VQRRLPDYGLNNAEQILRTMRDFSRKKLLLFFMLFALSDVLNDNILSRLFAASILQR
jgi:hypothetical protein